MLPLWQLDVVEPDTTWKPWDQKKVNRLLETGWRLLHIYTRKYEEDGV
ncbi:MAG TPA: hypothetical protein VN788_05075 [Verrucomicrobiae bacterium]|nr:hypothetical protein [Verrucomicrobiae bacterium]